MDSLVQKLFQKSTRDIYDEEKKALNLLAERMAAENLFHSGHHRSEAAKIVQGTAQRRLEGLASAFKEATGHRGQKPDAALIGAAKKEVQEMSSEESERMRRSLREVCARTGDKGPSVETFITSHTGQFIGALASRINDDLDLWMALEETRVRAVPVGNKAFVIMRLGPTGADVKRFYEESVRPAALACGLEAVPVDLTEGRETISVRILKMIEEAPLVIADLTYERPNCYFEAGYALGKGVHPIFTAREDHDPRRDGRGEGAPKVHFDLDGYKITYWKEDSLGEAKAELERRFRELLQKSASTSKPGETKFDALSRMKGSTVTIAPARYNEPGVKGNSCKIEEVDAHSFRVQRLASGRSFSIPHDDIRISRDEEKWRPKITLPKPMEDF